MLPSRSLPAYFLILVLVLVNPAFMPTRASGNQSGYDNPVAAGSNVGPFGAPTQLPGQERGVMRPDEETLRRWVQEYKAAATSTFDVGLEAAGYPTSFSLLSHIQYVPSERDQGSCGDCWAWAGTGVVEVALDVQHVNKDRLSIQYLNSNYNGGTGPGFACCGGWLYDFASFYSSKGFVIPWSNTNAGWADGGRACGGSTSVPASSISTLPNYPITSITPTTVQTQAVGQAAAISNIKNTLTQNKAVWFAFFMATAQDGNAFQSFWWLSDESAVWNPDPYSGHTYERPGGWGHAVLVVGYDDLDPSNRYWIILNSWGTASGGRPNGLYRMKMDINYDNYFYDPSAEEYYYSLYFQTLTVTFARPPVPFNQIVQDVVDASSNTAWVVMPDYTYSFDYWHTSAPKCGGRSVAQVSDIYAATYLFGSFANKQNQILDTDSGYISQGTTTCGFPSGISDSSPIVVIAGFGVNEVGYYYVYGTSQSQLYVSGGCIVRRDTGANVFCPGSPYNPANGPHGLFVIESFKDSAGRSVYLVWGWSATGTLAATAFVVEFVLKNPTSYASSWYVYTWDDATSGVSANSIPDAGDTFTQRGAG